MSLLDTRTVYCPYCGEAIDLEIDSSVREQRYIEDCWVCCRPICVHVSVGFDGVIYVRVSREND